MSASSTKYTFSDQVLELAKREGLSPPDLDDMVIRAARATHKLGNRRYHQFIFMVTGTDVTHMCVLGAPFDNSKKSVKIDIVTRELEKDEFVVHDECPDCEGSGCKNCKGTGFLVVVRRLKETVYKSTNGVDQQNERNNQARRFWRT